VFDVFLTMAASEDGSTRLDVAGAAHVV